MAKYTYKCQDCGDVFDLETTIQEKEEGGNKNSNCPKCQSSQTVEKFSLLNFIKNIFDCNQGCGCSANSDCKKENRKNKGCCSDKNSSKEKNGSCCG